jgi:hypothetical protein
MANIGLRCSDSFKSQLSQEASGVGVSLSQYVLKILKDRTTYIREHLSGGEVEALVFNGSMVLVGSVGIYKGGCYSVVKIRGVYRATFSRSLTEVELAIWRITGEYHLNLPDLSEDPLYIRESSSFRSKYGMDWYGDIPEHSLRDARHIIELFGI